MLGKNLGNFSKNEGPIGSSYAFSAIEGSLSFVLVVIFWLNLGPVFVRFISNLRLFQPLKEYLGANAPFFAMALGLVVSARLLMKTKLKTIATDKQRFDFPLALLCAALYTSVCIIFLLASIMAKPGDYRFIVQDFPQKLLLLPFVLFITPLQTTSEEFLLRCLPVRVFSRGTFSRNRKQILIISGLSALFFCLPHLSNQELSFGSNTVAVLSYYLLFGFAGTYLSMRTGGFEVSMGIHAANNLFIALICNYEHSSLPSLPLVRSSGPIGTWFEVVQLAVAMACIFLFLKWKGKLTKTDR
ncbi:CAAX amino terminal protease family [Sphaerochaeta pleomorpha str. Grapes]|uniref:CAAX amino terminal protease family n=1 Tax=Sphaerochaeta pleomorpha (strain ATCC BAA-1885 / DSM 22778 / Grapes) TaxID=158190 RepID=G8QUM5_SPHPG|nr:type II CAAX endopeptidase family protein [Sphaerochaeta pleomorpha]AEV30333.1 CAAX amino terminal protease family [Sphaerochaeta pleomorpha str. Grapes]